MGLSGLTRLRRAARLLRSRIASQAVILLYHRVAELDSDPQLLCVKPKHFAEHLQVLARYGYRMRVDELAESLHNGTLPRRAIAVSFDDGYADNLYNAKPLLQSYDVPATVFVTSGYIGRDLEFWWDELERLLLKPLTVPAELSLVIGAKSYRWKASAESSQAEHVRAAQPRSSSRVKTDTGSRFSLYWSLCGVLRNLPELERRRALEKLLTWSGAAVTSRSTHRPMTNHELASLAGDAIFEVGAHTVWHPVLSSIPQPMQESEVQGSKAFLEEALGRTVNSFSYPYGTRLDYTTETTDIVGAAGFTSACSNFAGTVWRNTDRFQLPRCLVRDWDGDTFEQKLREWSAG